MKHEEIVRAAVRYDGIVWSLPRPARHHHIIAAHAVVTLRCGSGEQGFLTSEGRFVNRRAAAEIAWIAGQTAVERYELFSEDLW
jgi:hypothetical protein